jgi:hypothetical protein
MFGVDRQFPSSVDDQNGAQVQGRACHYLHNLPQRLNEHVNPLGARLISYLVCLCARAGHEDQTLCLPGPFVGSRKPIYPEYPGASTQKTLFHLAESVSDSHLVGFSQLALRSLLWFSL